MKTTRHELLNSKNLSDKQIADYLKTLVDDYIKWWENTANDFLTENRLDDIDEKYFIKAEEFLTEEVRNEITKKLKRVKKLIRLRSDLEIGRIKVFINELNTFRV
jgi:hypothetical protein